MQKLDLKTLLLINDMQSKNAFQKGVLFYVAGMPQAQKRNKSVFFFNWSTEQNDAIQDPVDCSLDYLMGG